MIRWNASLIVVMCLMAAAVWAQQPPFSANLVYEPAGGAPLYTACDNTTPIPDGRMIKIFWDQDSDGPDDTDPQPTVCTEPPMCESGPIGTVNYNQFPMNGTYWYEAAGYFAPEYYFTSANELPAIPKYYLRIYEIDGITILWTSSVKTLTSGAQDVSWTRAEWTCGAGGPQCIVRDEHE